MDTHHCGSCLYENWFGSQSVNILKTINTHLAIFTLHILNVELPSDLLHFLVMWFSDDDEIYSM